MTGGPSWPGLGPAIMRAVVRSERANNMVHKRQTWRKTTCALELIEGWIAEGVPSDVNRKLTFENRGFWRPIYKSLTDRRMCVKSGAQVGKSIALFYAIALLAHLDHYQGRGAWVGLYLPTQEMVRAFSKGRLNNILTAVGQITGVPCGDTGSAEARAGLDKKTAALLDKVFENVAGEGMDLGKVTDVSQFVGAHASIDLEEPVKKRIDSANLKQIAESVILLGWINGLGIDAFPLDRLLIDEVRLMSPERVDRVEKRVMGSEIGTIAWTSTAGIPGDAIDVRWLNSDQRYFHNDCGCSDGVQLNQIWPNCLGEVKGEMDQAKRYYLYCPKCGKRIEQRHKGRWLPHNLEQGFYKGFNPHQLMTQQPLSAIAEAWARRDSSRGEFSRSILGMEFMDPDSVPITPDVIEACENHDLLWAIGGDVTNTCMGIDHGGGYNHYVIYGRAPNGKLRTLHAEVVFADDPFYRGAQLMKDYDVSIAVIEPLPNWVSARKFAALFPRRVFLVHWDTSALPPKQPIMWLDRPETDQEKKAAAVVKWKYTVRAHRNTALSMMTQNWRDRMVECPPGRALLGRITDTHGRELTVSVGSDVYHDHLMRIARRRTSEEKKADGIEIAERTGIIRTHWVKLARAPHRRGRPVNIAGNAADPHFAFAETMAHIAFTRLPRSEGRVSVHYS